MAGNVGRDSPVINFLSAIGKDLVMGAVAMEEDEEPLGKGLQGGVFVIINS